jgi:hypothetical protein
MMFSRPASTLRRFAALAAAFGIALQALWPLIAQARPKDSVSVPICSADGVRHSIELPLGRTQDGSKHCKLCVLGADKPVVLKSDLLFLSPERESESFLLENRTTPKSSTLFTARPRAPPQAS